MCTLAELNPHARSNYPRHSGYSISLRRYSIVFPASKYQHKTKGMSMKGLHLCSLSFTASNIPMTIKAASFYLASLYDHHNGCGSYHYISIRVLSTRFHLPSPRSQVIGRQNLHDSDLSNQCESWLARTTIKPISSCCSCCTATL
jgi:hypothetical protein